MKNIWIGFQALLEKINKTQHKMLIFSVTENFEKELADARDQNLQTLRTEEEKQM